MGVASSHRSGESDSGDLSKVCEFSAGLVVAVIDGLGHGPEAGIAARTAAEVVASGAGKPIVLLFQRCHQALKPTRGATMGIAEFNFLNRTLEWLAVGNVDGVLLRGDPAARPPAETVVQRGGVVGDRLPALQPSLLTLAPGDTLIMTTDGIDADFKENIRRGTSPQDLAEQICAAFAKGNDDALVLVARYRGVPA